MRPVVFLFTAFFTAAKNASASHQNGVRGQAAGKGGGELHLLKTGSKGNHLLAHLLLEAWKTNCCNSNSLFFSGYNNNKKNTPEPTCVHASSVWEEGGEWRKAEHTFNHTFSHPPLSPRPALTKGHKLEVQRAVRLFPLPHALALLVDNV